MDSRESFASVVRGTGLPCGGNGHHWCRTDARVFQCVVLNKNVVVPLCILYYCHFLILPQTLQIIVYCTVISSLLGLHSFQNEKLEYILLVRSNYHFIIPVAALFL